MNNFFLTRPYTFNIRTVQLFHSFITASLLILGGFVFAENAFDMHIEKTLPHNSQNFTQGLFFYEGILYESTGMYGQSALIKYNQDGASEEIRIKLGPEFFGEGATYHRGRIFQLTWKAGRALAYWAKSLEPGPGFDYNGEGWGLTSDGRRLWMSNGTDRIQVLKHNGELVREINVHFNGSPVDKINELEWVNGWLLANRFYDNHILVIDPDDGAVKSVFNLSEIANVERDRYSQNVLNGLAWDKQNKKLWITGKYWRQFLIADITLPKK